jgi:hypothetical protein
MAAFFDVAPLRLNRHDRFTIPFSAAGYNTAAPEKQGLAFRRGFNIINVTQNRVNKKTPTYRKS